jgi:hypothetical protein
MIIALPCLKERDKVRDKVHDKSLTCSLSPNKIPTDRARWHSTMAF